MIRLVVTADTHFPFDSSLIPDGDVFIHVGDLMYTGYLDEWYSRLDSLAALPHERKYLVPGNHDFHIERYEGMARAELRRVSDVRLLLENSDINIAGRRVMAIPSVTGLPGWAYNRLEYSLGESLKDRQADIVLSHGPMYKVLDAVNPDGNTARERNHVGSWALAHWYHNQEKKPEYVIHGHIHESYGEHHEWGTSFYNVAMCDRDYKQVNPAVVIDLE